MREAELCLCHSLRFLSGCLRYGDLSNSNALTELFYRIDSISYIIHRPFSPSQRAGGRAPTREIGGKKQGLRWGGSGPLILVPRDLTAELCLIALASLGLFACAGTPYGVFESARSIFVYAPRFARAFVVGNTPYGVFYWSLLGGFLCLVFCGCV